MAYFEHQGATLYYEERGTGRPLIFLHGASWDLQQWKRQMEHFSACYRVIAMDARGHGKSSLPPGRVSPDVFWQDVAALMDHLELKRAVICGLSMGGHVAIQLAVHAPDRVERSVSVGMGNYCRESRPYVRKTVGSMDHDVFNRVWKAVTGMESRAGLKGIACPVLILIGDHDTMTMRQQEYMHEQIKGSRLVIIQNAHHGTNLDNPEQVEAEMEQFFASINNSQTIL